MTDDRLIELFGRGIKAVPDEMLARDRDATRSTLRRALSRGCRLRSLRRFGDAPHDD